MLWRASNNNASVEAIPRHAANFPQIAKKAKIILASVASIAHTSSMAREKAANGSVILAGAVCVVLLFFKVCFGLIDLRRELRKLGLDR